MSATSQTESCSDFTANWTFSARHCCKRRSTVPASETSSIMVLDLQDLQFVDSAGLRVILAAHERSRQNGQALALTPGTEQVQRLFTIAGVNDHLRIIGSPDELFV